MFQKEYRFRGKHAVYVNNLTSVFEATENTKIFDRNIDVYLNAPIIGFLYHRQAELDTTKNAQTKEVYSQHIMRDTLWDCKDELVFNFQLIMLLDTEHEPDPQQRIAKAFNIENPDAQDEELFNRYVLGGVEVLYEQIIQKASSTDDYVGNLIDFISNLHETFNSTVNIMEILQQLGCEVNK